MHKLPVLLMTALTAGCVVLQDPPYPPTWAQVPKIHDCSSINGIYKDIGQAVPDMYGEGASGRSSLSNLLAPPILRSRGDPGTAEVIYTAGSDAQGAKRNILVATIHRVGRPDHQEIYTDDVQCTNGKVSISRYGRGKRNRILSKAEDGALIIEEGDYSAGVLPLLVPIPAFGYIKYWHRFEAADKR